MKYLFLALTIAATSAIASEKASVEYVKEAYNYCVESFEENDVTEAELLTCVNDELEAEGYDKFPTLKAVKAYIKKDK